MRIGLSPRQPDSLWNRVAGSNQSTVCKHTGEKFIITILHFPPGRSAALISRYNFRSGCVVQRLPARNWNGRDRLDVQLPEPLVTSPE